MPITPEGMPAAHVSPDGKYVTSVVEGQVEPAADRGRARRSRAVIDVQPGESVIRWSADGRYLFLRQNEGLTAMEINRLDLASGARSRGKN